MAAADSATRTRSLRRALLAWFDRHRRAMPWRDEPTPYRVFLSEIMLQQTQVATVIPYFERFAERLPDWQALAEASEEEVLALWSGLGYYRRARNLQAAARAVMAEHAGTLPANAKALAALPGVGRYTAGAVASIAFGREEPALDGNGVRLLTRLDALGGDPAREPLRAQLWEALGALVRGERPGDLNQAVMELGARLCKPRNPDCAACPIAEHCRAREQGDPSRYPEIATRAAAINLTLEVGIFSTAEGVLLARGERPFLGSLWNLPYRVVLGGGGVVEETWARLGLELRNTRVLGEGKHGITRYRLLQRVLNGEAEVRVGEKRVEYRRFPPEQIPQLGLPAFSGKLLKRFAGDDQ